MNYIKEIIKRNPELSEVKNLRLDGISTIKDSSSGLTAAIYVNYTYGILNSNFRSEIFPVMHDEWTKEAKCLFASRHREDEARRQRILS